MPVDKLRTVVRVQPQKAERQHPFDLIQRLLHRHLTPSQQGSRLGPAAVNVGEVQRMGKFALPRIPGMRDQVDLGETRSLHIPTIGLHRNVVLQQSARLGAPVDTSFPLALLRLQPAVDLPGTDAQQLFLHFRAPLCDTAHTLPGDIPTSPCSPLYPPQSTSESGYILSVSTAPPPVTFCMARYVSLLLLARRTSLKESLSHHSVALPGT